LGGNPGIAYSYERKVRGFEPEGLSAWIRGRLPFLLDVRSLPPEPWRAQPPMPGAFTSAITIVQNGKGNAARELRVEGVNKDNTAGYWRKAIFAADWSFQTTGAPRIAEFVSPGTAADCP